MANFTIQLGHLITAGFIPALTAYPIFDPNYRAALNQKIIDRYKFREIGLETPDLFNHFLNTRMNEIMPKFNKMYLADTLIFNPLYNSDLTETTERKTEGVTVGQSSAGDNNTSTATRGKAKSILANSDTPQGNLTIMDLEAGGYASNVQLSEQTQEDPDTVAGASLNTASSANEGTTTEEFVRKVLGYQGVNPTDMLLAYRNSLINIDVMIIDNLNDLFMGVY